MRKTIVVIGGGISGLSLCIFIKRNNPNFEVIVIEKNSSILKRIRITGNGKCNFANTGSIVNKYDHENNVLPILKEFDYQKIISFFNSINIKETYKDELVYPYSETSLTVINMFLKEAERLNIVIKLNESFINYDGKKVITDKAIYEYDYLIFSCGGVSYPQISSSEDVLNTLKNHGYEIITPTPCLTPLKIKENVHLLDGLRVKAMTSLYIDKKFIYQESGEVQFKDKGIGGIVINNLSFYIPKNTSNIKIHLDFVFDKKIDTNEYEYYVHPTLAHYLKEHQQKINDCIFTFKDFYGFDVAHTFKGGVSFSNLSLNLESNHEKNVFFTGEILDTCGMCGGYNIMWAIASAYKVSKNIK